MMRARTLERAGEVRFSNPDGAGGGGPAGPHVFRAIRTTTTDIARTVDVHRRVTYLVLFRLVLISLVLGATILVSWLSDVDLSEPNSLALFAIIATTYLLTIVYSVALSRIAEPRRLADIQLVADLAITTFLIHITGGAQSAYSFFFPLSIIGAATVRFRAGAVVVAVASMGLFSIVSLLGWLEVVPSFAGQRLDPAGLTSAELARAMALNLAAFAGVAVLAYNLGAQIQQTSASLETQRTRVADLRALYQDIVRCLSSGLITIDDDQRIITTNQAACEILGVEPDEMVGQPVAGFVPGLASALAEIGEDEVQRRVELEVARPGGAPVILGISISPLRDNQDHVIGRIINFQDLTELRQMEAQIRRAERLAVLGTLAAGVAHEIRNPLASISGSIELLRADPRTDDDRALMEIVTREVDRLNGLITDLLDYTNPHPRELLRFDLAELVGETLTVFEQDRSFRGVSVTLTGDAAGRPSTIVADPGRVRQVLWNLLRNAASAAHSAVEVRVESHGDRVIMEVSDDGPGIDPELLPRVFDPFFTTKSKGSGLGLATCHSIVTEHGGAIRVDSDPGQGTRFTVDLPRETHRDPAGPAEPDEPDDEPAGPDSEPDGTSPVRALPANQSLRDHRPAPVHRALETDVKPGKE